MTGGGPAFPALGYGLFGMLRVLSRRNRRFADVIDQQTIRLFVAWFFICIVITYVGFPIGNVAHGFGLVLRGAGWMDDQRPAAGTRDRVFGDNRFAGRLSAGRDDLSAMGKPLAHDAYGEAKLGYDLQIAGRNEEAVRWFRDAVKINPALAAAWLYPNQIQHIPARFS